MLPKFFIFEIYKTLSIRRKKTVDANQNSFEKKFYLKYFESI
jgi:hypothetical protein